MKKTILFSILSMLFNTTIAQNFPIPFKMKKSFDECSKCNVKTRSTWKLVNPESYSEKIKEVIEYKIFTNKTYPEKTAWYFKEQKYDKACEMTNSGKHIWIDKIQYESEILSKQEYLDFEKREQKKLEEIKEEKLKEKNEKNKEEDFINYFNKKYFEINHLKDETKTISDFNLRKKNYEVINNFWFEYDSLKQFSDLKYLFLTNNVNFSKINDENYENISLIDRLDFCWYLIEQNDLIRANNLLLKLNNIGFYRDNNGYGEQKLKFIFERYLYSSHIYFMINYKSILSNYDSNEAWIYRKKLNVAFDNKDKNKTSLSIYENYIDQLIELNQIYSIKSNIDFLKFYAKSKLGLLNIEISLNAKNIFTYINLKKTELPIETSLLIKNDGELNKLLGEIITTRYSSSPETIESAAKLYPNSLCYSGCPKRFCNLGNDIFQISAGCYNKLKIVKILNIHYYIDNSGTMKIVNTFFDTENIDKKQKFLEESIEIKNLDIKK